MQTLNVIEVPPSGIEVRQDRRAKIIQFEDALAMIDGAQFGDMPQCPLKHSFVDGIYVREIYVPKGTLLTGKIHRHSHPNFLMSGEVSVFTEGKGEERLTGPMAMISEPSTKRVVYAHTDVVWITVHHNPDNLTDLKQLEDLIIAPSYEALEKGGPCLG